LLLLVVFLISDAIYSYNQHLHANIDGDLSSLVAPSNEYKKVLEDPFGFQVLKTKEMYPATNRHFAHYFTYVYFRKVPLWLQTFMTPVESLYSSAALAKSLIQTGLIIMLAAFISLPFSLNYKNTIYAAVLVTPFFQAAGFHEYMGVIDRSVSYTFFYALPSLLLLIFFFPYYKAAVEGRFQFHPVVKALWPLFIFILAFHGPLSPPVLLVVCSLTILCLFLKNWSAHTGVSVPERIKKSLFSINPFLLFSFSLAIVVSLYSFYIGTYNLENTWSEKTLSERYMLLFSGIRLGLLTFSNGIFPVILLVLINFSLLKNHKDSIVINKTSYILGFILIFSLLYMFMLPMGGYRSYRPYILRRDTLQPVLLGLYMAWGITSLYILKNAARFQWRKYGYLLIFIPVIYTILDPSRHFNECEKNILKQISESDSDCIRISDKCTVMQWEVTGNCEATHCQSIMLEHWRITPSRTNYYYEEPYEAQANE